MNLMEIAPRILAATPHPGNPAELGRSREGRPIWGHRFGSGRLRVSLIGGCHADEPVGPWLLDRLVAYLGSLPPEDALLEACDWWIVPHANPDGNARNAIWSHEGETEFDPIRYLRHAVREGPGDDVEFGFPRDSADRAARPENRAIFAWWHSTPGPFHLHVSLHGMAIAAGPWFLIDAAWIDRTERFRARCRESTHELGYVLHDVDRRGEKGFHRIERGFSTRPESRAMRRFFLDRGDPTTASRFRPNSMETIRSFGGDPLTLVTEMPLFITPGVGESLGPPDPVAEEWRRRIARWKSLLARGDDAATIREESRAAGLRPMPIRDQWILQWTCIARGLETVGTGDGTSL